MHGSLIDSHHRSSLSSSNDQGILAASSVNHLAVDDDDDDSSPPPHSSNIPKGQPTSLSSRTSLRKRLPSDDDEDEEDETTKTQQSLSESLDFFRWTKGHRHVMLTFFTICLFAFMTGVEYAVILPTAFDYVKTMTNADIYVGLILSSYSISGSIAGIVMGKLSDKTGKVKFLILISNVFAIIGNILYFLTNRIHIVLLGRLVAGVGMGAVPPILADVAHRTTEKDRTKAISIILGCRQFGLLIGPCFTLLIRIMNFHIGSIHVHKLNGPGFLMATVWLVLQFVCFFCFYDRVSVTPSNVPLTNDHRSKQDEPHSHQQERISMKTYRDQYLRTEMFVLFLATFITYFNQTALETIVAAFTEKHFNWTSVHTSILFAFAGLEIIVVYLLLVKVFSKRFKDRTVLIIGFISLTLACILGTFFTWASISFGWSTRSAQGLVDKRLLVMFIVFVILDLMGLPFIAATSVSLFTKLTRKELQGFSQGVQRFVMGIGTIVGPLFASSLLTRLHIMMTTMLGLTLLTLIAIFIVIKRLRPISEKSLATDLQARRDDRSSSLEDDSDEPGSVLALSSKKCYITLVQHDDDDEDDEKHDKYVVERPSTGKSRSNNDGCVTTTRNRLSSTNIVCESDEQQQEV